MNMLLKRKFMAGLSLYAAANMVAITAAFGQNTDATATKSEDKVTTLDKFVVTGSLIPATLDEQKAIPVQIIDSAAIQMSGVNTNVLDVLRKTVPQLQGSNNYGVENANISGGTNGGASVASLRNVDTLVLINGKRMANNAGAAGGGVAGVDLNMIPLSAIDSIEVLKDGASALYGSDAVSGVINIKLKKDYRGAEVGFHTSMAKKDNGGTWRDKSAYMIVGTGNDKTNLLFSASWSREDPLWAKDMSYSNNPVNTASLAGILVYSGKYYQLNTSLNTIPEANRGETLDQLVADGVYTQVAGPYELADRSTIRNWVDKRTAMINASHLLNDYVTFTSDFIYAETQTNYQLNPQPLTTTSTSLIANGVTTINTPGVSIRNRYVGGPNRIYDNTSDSYRWTAGFEGKMNDYFNWSVGVNYSLTKRVDIGYNQVLNSALQDAIVSGLFDIFAYTQDADDVAAAGMLGNSIARYKSGSYTYYANVGGKIFDLPAGPIQYAVGAEYRKETLSATADLNSIIPAGGTTSLWNSGTSLSPFDGGRSAKGYFAEFKVPVVKDLPGLHLVSVDGAVRHESFSDGNSATVPKVSLAWFPFNDELRLRGTFGKSFSEPTLIDLYGPVSTGYTSDLSSVRVYDSSGVATGEYMKFQGHQSGGSNPDLTPSHAKSWTLGFVYSPKWAKGLDITVDYFRIQQTDLVGSLASGLTMIQSVEQYGAASPYAQYVTLNAFANQAGAVAVTAPGQLSVDTDKIYVLTNIANISSQQQHGFDVGIKYELPWKHYGRFNLSSEAAILQSFVSDGTEYAGLDWYGTLPKFRSYTTLDWTYRGYSAVLGWTYIKAVDADPVSEGGSGYMVGPYHTLDIQVGYDLGNATALLKGVTLGLGVNNLTNRVPPQSPNYSSPPFDGSGGFSAFGRIFYADVKIKF
jgi:iron complex outermembrane recepter protein